MPQMTPEHLSRLPSTLSLAVGEQLGEVVGLALVVCEVFLEHYTGLGILVGVMVANKDLQVNGGLTLAVLGQLGDDL
tara:strand:- start:469 stop:699 length:231 start_codon:yes stop_codon:yes gene_type:complete